MRVALLTNEYPPHVYGGAGVHVEYLTRELARIEDGAHSVDVRNSAARHERRKTVHTMASECGSQVNRLNPIPPESFRAVAIDSVPLSFTGAALTALQSALDADVHLKNGGVQPFLANSVAEMHHCRE